MRLALTLLAVLLATAIGLTACGRKGPLERPTAAKTADGQTIKAERKPNRPFILDGLLR